MLWALEEAGLLIAGALTLNLVIWAVVSAAEALRPRGRASPPFHVQRAKSSL
jgi:hypothetical protein